MMMTPEQSAKLQAKAQPLMEMLVEVLNELSELNNAAGLNQIITGHNEILTAGGTVVYQPWTRRWEIGIRR
ncbi:hypothetical protein Caci_2942 [Catenulispora acidiphila DSM 44928]|uniref:Uncharacterized protein n=1 Tax=Catenulispora acidiphila (strain DSM 44928 / JCM 14897 / NBRC 102108 / NRRL B-24433 / ID139908) TaxID=479433 RepID=C7Q2V9_CATAD|nr:hypothetical protein [Catenulispora acidiphila]ACU71851.1 hypothetical protein Caci_2942 [Catenulispora acidiphila DSM 44928]